MNAIRYYFTLPLGLAITKTTDIGQIFGWFKIQIKLTQTSKLKMWKITKYRDGS